MQWNGKRKALTFSYDDGITQDIRFAGILNRHGMKATFNINSAKIGTDATWQRGGITIGYQTSEQLVQTCTGHEMAAHTANHPHLTELDDDAIRAEIEADKAMLTALCGKPVRGMAYPFGTWDARVVEVLRGCGMEYGRTVATTGGFSLPERPLEWACTCHHNDPALFDLAEAFIALQPDNPACFSIWGHSYEFDVDNNWERIETLCQMLAGRNDIFYGTNTEVLL